MLPQKQTPCSLLQNVKITYAPCLVGIDADSWLRSGTGHEGYMFMLVAKVVWYVTTSASRIHHQLQMLVRF